MVEHNEGEGGHKVARVLAASTHFIHVAYLFFQDLYQKHKIPGFFQMNCHFQGFLGNPVAKLRKSVELTLTLPSLLHDTTK